MRPSAPGRGVSTSVEVLRIEGDRRLRLRDEVARELRLQVLLNGRELVGLRCSPTDLEDLALGYLLSEGLIERRGDVQRVSVDDRGSRVEVWVPRPLRPAEPEPVRAESRLSVGEVLGLAAELQRRSAAFQATGGVHSAALAGPGGILVFREDIGRRNALDKVFGRCLLEDIPTEGRFVITSGRVPSEVVMRAARRRAAAIISPAAPTDAAIELARRLRITLLGFVRDGRFNAYAGDWRIDG